MMNTPVVALAAPTIEGVSDNFVSLEMLERGINVRVPIDPSQAPIGFTVVFEDQEGYEVNEVKLGPSDPNPLIFFPPDKLRKLHGEVIKVWYRTFPDNLDSPESTYTFDAIIYRPQLPDVKDRQMPWSVLDNGFNVVIRPYKNIKVGDQLRVFMIGTYARSSHFIDVEVQNPEENLAVWFSPEKTRLTAGGETSIFYEIKRSGSNDISYSVSFQSIPPTPELTPKHIFGSSIFIPTVIANIDESGSYPFTLNFSSPATKGEKLTLVALDESWACKVYERTIEEPENLVTILLPLDMFYTSPTQELIVIRGAQGNQNSSSRVPISLIGGDEVLRRQRHPMKPLLISPHKA